MRVKLSEARLTTHPRGARQVLCDSVVPGLRARGGPRGWVFYYQGAEIVGAGGQVTRPAATLGAWSPLPGAGLSVKEARRKALELLGEHRVQVPAGVTVRSLAEDFLAWRYPKNQTRRKKVQGLLECHALPTVGGMAIRAVTREHCVALVEAALIERRLEAKGSVRRGGRAPAEALCRILRQLFRHAVKTGKLETLAHSPAELLEASDFGIEPAIPRQRWLDATELAQLFQHLEVDLSGLIAGAAYYGQVSLAVRGAIILGPHLALRPKALVGMRWDEVNLDAATLTVRGGRGAKLRHHLQASALDYVVPLTATPMAVLTRLKEQSGGEVYVFPTASKTGHLSGDVLADALLRLTRGGGRVRLPGGQVRPHDARRTWASAAERLGVDRLVIERALQHSLGRVGDTYLIAGDVDRRRTAHELVDAHWARARGEPAIVVAYRRPREGSASWMSAAG